MAFWNREQVEQIEDLLRTVNRLKDRISILEDAVDKHYSHSNVSFFHNGRQEVFPVNVITKQILSHLNLTPIVVPKQAERIELRGENNGV